MKKANPAMNLIFVLYLSLITQLEGIETLFEVKIKKSDTGISLKYQGEKTPIGSGDIEVMHTIQEPYETIKKEKMPRIY